ncbi:hypothetical protein GALL_446980 [mine drainage metagenome]|uniref:Uncharacterized protein n=1 Tax=mine drainage metagenome TaxID=410659 RepID=A0A1J5PPZ9_9ZZZZ
MRFLSAKQIGRKHGLSYQKVNAILTAKGLIDETTKKPSPASVEDGLTKICTVKSQFNLKMLDFVAWDYKKVKIFFPICNKKNEEDKPKVNQYRSIDPLDEICDVFSKFGDILDITDRTPVKGLTQDAVDAVLQSIFYDPHFIGGSKFLHRPMFKADAELIKKISLALAIELHKEAEKVNSVEAEANLNELEVILNRILQNAL